MLKPPTRTVRRSSWLCKHSLSNSRCVCVFKRKKSERENSKQKQKESERASASLSPKVKVKETEERRYFGPGRILLLCQYDSELTTITITTTKASLNQYVECRYHHLTGPQQ